MSDRRSALAVAYMRQTARLRWARRCCSLSRARGPPGSTDELRELQCKRAGGSEILLRMWRPAAARVPRMRPRQFRFGKILLGMRRATCAFFRRLARDQGTAGEWAAALCLGQGLHAKASCAKNSHLARDARRRTQAGDGAVRGFERLDGAHRRARSGGGAGHPRAGARSHDGGGASLRGDREPRDGRRHHGPFRRACCA